MGGQAVSTPSGAPWGCCGRCMWFLNPRASLCADQKDPAHKCGIGFFRPAKLRGKEKRKGAGKGKGKTYIESKTLSKIHGNRNKDHESAIPGGQVRQTQETERGERGAVLGRMGGENSRYSRRISKNCLPSACDTGKAGLVRQ